MARYQLPQYQSTYRDKGSVKVNQVLSDRFAKAVVADDALAESVDAMQSADYEGDSKLKRELAEEYNANLKERAENRDYENAPMAITKDSRAFIKGYRPIQENFGRVQAYQAEQKKKLDSGELDEATYSATMALSNKGYNGLEKNEDGTINKDSYFSGYRTVKNVDIATEVDEAMEGYKARTGAEEIQLVGQGKDKNMMVKTDDSWSVVPQADVDAIFNNILARPDVQASLRQKGDVGTSQVTDEQISNSIENSLYGNPEDKDSKGLIAQYEELIASGKKDKNTVDELNALEAAIEERKGLLGENSTESPEELSNKRQNYMKNDVINQEVNRELGTAYAKYVRNDVETSYISKYDSKSLADYSQKVSEYIPIVYEKTGMSELNAPSGTSVESVNEYIQIHDNVLSDISNNATAFAVEQGYIETDNTGNPTRMVTIEDIKTGNIPEGMEGLLAKYRSQVYATETQKVTAERRLELAKETTDYAGAINILDDIYTQGDVKISGNELLDYGKGFFNDPELKEEDLLNILNKAYTTNLYDPGMYTDESFKGQGFKFIKKLAEDNGFNRASTTKLVEKLLRSNKSKIEKADDAVSKYLSDNSRVQTGGMTSSTAPGITSEESQKSTKAIKTHFENSLLNPTFKIFYNGQVQSDGTGTAASLVEDLDWDDSAVTVSQVTFDTTPYLGEPTLQFNVKGMKDSKVVFKTIKVPYSNLKQDGMDEYFDKPGYRMALEVNIARKNNLPNTTIGFFNKEGVQTSALDWKFATGESSGDVITYIDAQGIKRSITAEAAAEMINDAGINHTFRTLTEQ
jgi:hypothetical protein